MRIERQILFWLAAALIFAVAILALRSILLPFVAGAVIAYALNPIADKMQGLGLPRAAASALIVALLVLVLLLALVFVVPLIVNQMQQLVVSLPGEVDRFKIVLESWARERLGARFSDFQSGLDRVVAELSGNWASLAGAIASSVWSHGLAVVNFLSLLLITPLVVFYLLNDWHPMLDKIGRWLPRDHEAAVRRLAAEVNDAVAAFIRGQGLVCIILGVFYAVALTWAELRHGAIVGLATGILTFVPFVGWALGLIVASGLAIVQAWPDTWLLIKVLSVFAIGQALDSALLGPKVVGSKVGLHPVWLIFALFVFSYMFGIVGALVAVPVAAAIAVLVRFALEIYLASSIYGGRDGVATSARDDTRPGLS